MKFGYNFVFLSVQEKMDKFLKTKTNIQFINKKEKNKFKIYESDPSSLNRLSLFSFLIEELWRNFIKLLQSFSLLHKPMNEKISLTLNDISFYLTLNP